MPDNESNGNEGASATQAQPEQQQPAPAKKTLKVARFEGAFSGFAVTAYTDCYAWKFPPQVAHKMAIDYSNEIARGMKDDADLKAAVGKAGKKDGECRIKITGKTAKLSPSANLRLMRALQQMDGLIAEGLFKGLVDNQNHRDYRYLRFAKYLNTYIKDCEEWAAGFDWIGVNDEDGN